MNLLKWFAPRQALTPEKSEDPTQAKCTYCGGTEFYEGPSGGMSQNILCANPDCRHWFNWHGGILPMDDLHRVEPTAADKEQEAAARKSAADEAFLNRFQEGARAYKEKGLLALRMAQRAERMTYQTPNQIDELCGFMAAMADDVRVLLESKFGDKVPLYRHGSDVPVGHLDTVSRPSYGPGSVTDAASYVECPATGHLCDLNPTCQPSNCKKKE